MNIAPICPYCGKFARKTTGREIYPNHASLHAKHFWACRPCDAWVGCHPGTSRPLGVPANNALRRARQAAHKAFDALWLTGKWNRVTAYRWLADALGIARADCHIGQFDVATCRRVVEAVAALHAGKGVTS